MDNYEEEIDFLESLATAIFLRLLDEKELTPVCYLHGNGSFPLAQSLALTCKEPGLRYKNTKSQHALYVETLSAL